MPIISSQLINHALPVCAGISFAVIGIAYQLAARHRITPMRIFLSMGICGTVSFAFRCATRQDFEFSIQVTLLGIAAGISQYVSVILVGRAMHLGPFSLAWCMVALNFAPVVLYTQVIRGIRQPWTQWLAVLIAVLCCFLAAAGHNDGNSRSSSSRSKAMYGLLLLTILLVNALPNIAIQELNLAGTGHLLDLFFLCMYAAIAVTTFFDALKGRELAKTFRLAWVPGLIAGVGSTGGMLLIGIASGRSGPAAFLISSMVMLIVPMLAAILVFHERATARWTATLALGLLAIALANI